jgi:hypothetical protein
VRTARPVSGQTNQQQKWTDGREMQSLIRRESKSAVVTAAAYLWYKQQAKNAAHTNEADGRMEVKGDWDWMAAAKWRDQGAAAADNKMR